MSEARTVEELVDRLPSPRLVPSAEYRTSQNVGKLFAALAKAQGEIRGALKDATNPHFKAKYADLASIVDAARPLAKHGIATVQVPFSENGEIGVTTILGHDSGEWISGRLSVKPLKLDPQGAGSVLTYLRRYSLAAMAGIAPEDDDGEAAMGRGNGNGRAEFQDVSQITAAQRDELLALIAETGSDVKLFCEYLNVPSVAEIPGVRFGEARFKLEQKKKAKASKP
jgi:hypothetical protein